MLFAILKNSAVIIRIIMIDEIAIPGEIIAAESQLWADEQVSMMCFVLSGMWFRTHLLVLPSWKQEGLAVKIDFIFIGELSNTFSFRGILIIQDKLLAGASPDLSSDDLTLLTYQQRMRPSTSERWWWPSEVELTSSCKSNCTILASVLTPFPCFGNSNHAARWSG